MKDLFLAFVEIELCWVSLHAVRAMAALEPREVYGCIFLYGLAAIAMLTIHAIVENDLEFGE